MLQSNDTKKLYLDLVRDGWDLKQDDNMLIEYKADNNSEAYLWKTKPGPVCGHSEGYSWEETMLWISLRIEHNVLAEELWNEMREDWKMENVLNV